MIVLSNNIQQIHYFGDKIVVNKDKNLIKLNKEMSELLDIVINNAPCTIEKIADIYVSKNMVISSNEDRNNLIDIINHFLMDTPVGKQLFSVGNINQNVSFVKSGIPGKFMPMTINFEMTNKCNLLCSHCYKNAKLNTFDFLSFDRVKSLCELLQPSHLAFSLTGGECTLHPQFNDIVKYLSTYGEIDMVTNGTQLYKIDREILKIFKVICISLYGTTDEEYFNNTGLKNGIEIIKKSTNILQDNNCLFNMSIILDKEKIKNIERYVEFAYQCGANNIQIGVPAKSGRLTTINKLNEIWNISEEELRYAYVQQRILQRKYNEKIDIITWDRDVYETKYQYEDPYNPSNFYKPHCMKCGAGVLHWIVSENFLFRPCALMPESFKPAVFDFNSFKNYINGNNHINWENIMLNFEQLCQVEGKSAGDYCPRFIDFLHEKKN